MHNIRPLRESDKDDILEIARHTWEGHDYLPYSFDAWLKDSNSHTAAIEYENHVIALANLRVIENGRTGWMEGLRVHPNHRGESLASVLTSHVIELAKSVPVERVRYTTATENETSLHLGQKVGMQRKFDLAVHWQGLPKEIPDRRIEVPLKQAGSSKLYPDLIDAGLLPHNVVIFDWKALDATLEGLGTIEQVSDFWIQMQNDVIKAFSLGFARDSKDGNTWCCTIYTKEESCFLDNLSHHANIASERKCNVFFVTFQTNFVETLKGVDWAQFKDGDDDFALDFALTLLERVL